MFNADTGAGATQGASAGAAIGGPWGALIGGVIGHFIGGSAGRRKRKAKMYAEKAAKVRRQQQQMQLAVQRRDIVRQTRLAQARAAVAGASDTGVSSSSVMGASASISAQSKSALSYFDTQVGLDIQYQQYAKKAGEYAAKADELTSMLGAAGDAAKVVGDVIGMARQNNTQAQNNGTFTSFNNTAAVSNMENNSAFNTFGSSLNLG